MRVAILLVCLLGLAACDAEPEVERLEPAPDAESQDFRTLVSTITSAQRDRLPGGIIITATGLPPTQGWWSAELVYMEDESDTRTRVYEFRIAEPFDRAPPGTERSREVVVGRFLSDQTLEGVSEIVVRSSSNSRSIRP